MSKRNITKFSSFVIFVMFTSIAAGCSHASISGEGKLAANAEQNKDYEKPKVMGTISNPEITESSGLAASRCQNGVLWTHNDAGSGPFIFAFSPEGKSLGTWRVTNGENRDWEDIDIFKDESGKCFLYIGDIGDNKSGRSGYRIYRIAEPQITPDTAGTTEKQPAVSTAAEVLNYVYSDSPHNAETMMVHPSTGDIYVLTKRVDGPSLVFKIAPSFGTNETVKASKIGELAVPAVPNGLLTGGAISPDGKRAVVCDYTSGYEIVLPPDSKSFDDIWKQKPTVVDLGDRKQGEAVEYTPDGKMILATSEKKNSPITAVVRK